MGKKKDKRERKVLQRRLEDAVTAAEQAARRAEKASTRARKDARRLAERVAEVDSAPSAPAAATPSTDTAAPGLESATRDELLALARERDLRGRSSMSKAELVRALG